MLFWVSVSSRFLQFFMASEPVFKKFGTEKVSEPVSKDFCYYVKKVLKNCFKKSLNRYRSDLRSRHTLFHVESCAAPVCETRNKTMYVHINIKIPLYGWRSFMWIFVALFTYSIMNHNVEIKRNLDLIWKMWSD